MPGLFFDFHFPVDLKNLLEKMIGRKTVTVSNHNIILDNASRKWFSQPRASTDETIESLTINFKIPLSVSEFSAEFLRKSSRVEIWYKDRSNNWRQVLDRQRVPLGFSVTSSDDESWYPYKSGVYPIVAKSIQVRMKRESDGSRFPYTLGVKNTLIKRNIYNRGDGIQQIEEEQDPLGNVITKYIKDWDASKAVDDQVATYWKSSPQPDPNAAVSYYMDIRTEEGASVSVDKVYLDPVYKGQSLNVYYSSDDTVSERRLSPTTIIPLEDVNTEWKQTLGRVDIVGQEPSQYSFSSHWGPLRQQDAWVGIEWTPDFPSNAGPSLDPVLLSVTGGNLPTPYISYSSGDQAFVLGFTGGGVSYRNTFPLDKPFSPSDTLRIAVGWEYVPEKRMHFKVINQNGDVLISSSRKYERLPDVLSFDSKVEIKGFRGLYTALVIKLENINNNSEMFLRTPTLYVSPDPVLADPTTGDTPSTTLDNAIFAVDWTLQEHGSGGRDDSEYANKVWTPVWRDYFVEKGFIYFPEPVITRYLKFEFTSLTEEPYPIYEAGIDTQYKVFPIHVEQTSTQGPRLNLGSGVGGLFNFANLNGVKTINWFDFNSVRDAVNQVFGRQYEPVNITPGQSYISRAVPNTFDSPISESFRLELAANALNRRHEFDPYVIARNESYTTIKGEGLLKIAPYTNLPWEAILEANPGAIETTAQPGALSVRGADWWIFPGQTLKIPAAVMRGLTNSSTVTEVKASNIRRVRFTTTSVHKYDIRTVRRDAAVAYFAGLREITPYTSSFISEEDRDSYNFLTYTSPPWTLSGLEPTITDVMAAPEGEGIATFQFNTSSTFSKVKFDFRDSGFRSSDAMWSNEDSDHLSYNTSVTDHEGAVWTDFFAAWEDGEEAWGSPRGLVSITVDPDRLYQGKRVLRFSRQKGSGEAGVRVRQRSNYNDKPGKSRIRSVIYKPFQTNNEVRVRLSSNISGEVIFEELINVPSGQWFEYVSPLFSVDDGTADYTVELTLSGDEQDEVYVNDLHTEVTHISYYVAPGTGPLESLELYDVTELRDLPNSAFVFPEQIRAATVVATLRSDREFLYGLEIRPTFLE